MAEPIDPRLARSARRSSPSPSRGREMLGELTVQRFELVPVAGDLAILRLLLGTGDAGVAPAQARLHAAAASSGRAGVFPAQGPALERRVPAGGRPRAGELLWRAAFGLPLELAAADDAEFSLLGAGDDAALPLPRPRRRPSARGVAPLALAAPRLDLDRRAVATHQRLAALATAAVVTATSSPAAALADGLSTSPAPVSGSATAVPAAAGAPAAPAGAQAPGPAAGPSAPAGDAAAAPTDATPAAASSSATASGATTPTTSPAPIAPAASTAAAPVPSPTTATAVSGTTATSTSTPSAAPGVPPAQASAPAQAPSTPPSGSPVAAVRPGGSPQPTGPGRRSGIRRDRPASTVGGELVSAGALVPSRHRFARSGPVLRLFASRGERSRRAAPRTHSRACHTTDSSLAIAYAAAGLPAPAGRLTAGFRGCTTPAGAPAHLGAAAQGTGSAPRGALLEILPDQPGPRHPAGSAAPRPVRVGVHRRLPATRPAPGRAPHPAAPAPGLRALGSDPAVPGPGAAAPSGPVSSLSSTAPGFLVPQAWTGTVTPDPSLTGAVTDLSGLLANGDRPPSFLVPIYMQAGHRYGIPWPVLAAINAIETDYGRNLNTSSAGAIGWMQFEPATWKRYGMAVDGHSVPNPYDPRDAIFSAARYLAAAGASRDLAGAIFAYNHAGWYVQDVLTRATAIAHHVQYQRATVRRGTFTVDFATHVRRHPTVVYRGGVLSHFDRLIAAANMVSAAQFPYLWGGGHEQPARFGPFDCSGSVSYVLQQAGYRVATSVSGDIASWRFPTGPGRVTIFFNPTHTFMRIGNRFFGTSLSRPGGGAGWIDVNRLPAGYLDGFAEVHVPRLGVDSFAPARHRR